LLIAAALAPASADAEQLAPTITAPTAEEIVESPVALSGGAELLDSVKVEIYEGSSASGTPSTVAATTAFGEWKASTSLEEGTYTAVAVETNLLNESEVTASEPVTFVVEGKPVVTANPSDHSAKEGSSTQFKATARGTPTPEVTWEVSTDGGSSWNEDTSDSGAHTNTLTVSPVQASEDGHEYRAHFVNVAGEATSSAARLEVVSEPEVTSNPTSVIVDAGEGASFSAEASGLPTPTVQWQVKHGAGSWENDSDASAHSHTLTIASTTPSQNGNEYRAVFTNKAGFATTTEASLDVRFAPTVSKNPTKATVTEGSPASFKAEASGNPSPQVQWEVSTDGFTWEHDTTDAGTNTTTLTITDPTLADNGNEYRAAFSNGVGGIVTSAAATLLVEPRKEAPVVTEQPESQSVLAGEKAVFEAAARGVPTPEVQWQVEPKGSSSWSNIGGASKLALVISSASESQNGSQYRAVFKNSTGTATTEAATLTVSPRPEAPRITKQPANVEVAAGKPASFTASAVGVPTPEVQWQVSTDGGATWEADSTDAGNTTNTLTIASVAASQSGNLYRAVYSNASGSAETVGAHLKVLVPPHVTLNPLSQSVAVGSGVAFTAAATGVPEPHIEWQRSIDSGKTWAKYSTAAELVIVSVSAGEQGYEFRASFSNGIGEPAISSAATLTVTSAPVVKEQPLPLSAAEGKPASFTAAASGIPAPEVKWQVSADNGVTWNPDGEDAASTKVSGSVATSTLTIAAVTPAKSGFQYRALFKNGSGSVATVGAVLTVLTAPVIKLNPPETIKLAEGERGTIAAAATGVPEPKVQWEYRESSSGEWKKISGATEAEYEIPPAVTSENGFQLRAVFTNSVGRAETTPTTLEVTNAPAVKAGPSDTAVIVGSSASFTALGSGSPAPDVEWQVSKDGGATWSTDTADAASRSVEEKTLVSSTLLIASTSADQNGNEYRAVFTRPGAAAAATAPARLTVEIAPTVTVQPISTSVNQGETAIFSAAANGIPAPTVQWEASSDGGGTWSELQGATSNTLTLPSVTLADSGHMYRARFTNLVGSTASSPATLTVVAPAPGGSAGAHAPPIASFTVFPQSPYVGEQVSLASTSSDASSPLTGFAWDTLGNGTFTAGGSVRSTTFTTAGAHNVTLRVTAADGQTSTVTQTITVRRQRLALMQPFPIVRIAGSDSAFGARISLLTAQVPVGAHATVICRGRGCPSKPEVLLARSPKRRAGVVVLSFRRFQRSLRAGVVLEVRVYKAGTIGKYTSFKIRRSKLPVRVDACIGPTGTGKPFGCPT
jgi:hypothetical protein